MTDPIEELLRDALAGTDAWLVGGALRERLRGRATRDLDVAVADPDAVPAAARRVARAAGGHAFPLSDAFGAWRAVAGDDGWQIDLTPLQGADLDEDLARRDLTVNAIAAPVAGGPTIDPHGGAADLAAGRLRMVGPEAFTADPVRVLRLARFAAELEADPEPATAAAARAAAAGLETVAGERLLPELGLLLAADAWARGIAALEATGALAPLLPAAVGSEGRLRPEVAALLAAVLAPDATVPEATDADRAALAARLAADGVRLGLALGALLHRASDPVAALEPLRPSQRLRDDVGRIAGAPAALDPGRLAALAAARPPLHAEDDPRRGWHATLRALRPVAPEAILLARHARGADPDVPWAALLERGLRWTAPPAAPVRGDALAAALDLRPGPLLGHLLEELAWATAEGLVDGREAAVARARDLLGG